MKILSDEYSCSVKKSDRRHHDSIALQYDELWVYYSRMADLSWLIRKYEVQSFLSQGKVKIVLDLGAGTGVFSIFLIKKGFEVSAVDLSNKMLEVCKEKEKRLHLVIADAENLPFRDLSFDACICSNILHHLPNIDFALNEVYRVLRISGLIFIYEPNAKNFISFFIVPLMSKLHYLLVFLKLFQSKKKAPLVDHEKTLSVDFLKNRNFDIMSVTSVGFIGTLISRQKFFNRSIIPWIVVAFDEILSHCPVINKFGGMIKVKGRRL